MSIILDIPDHLKTRYNLGSRVSFDDFTQKIFGDDFISPDLTFVPVDELSKSEKNKLLVARKYDKKLLINL